MDCLDESDTKWRYQVINHGTNEEPHLAVHEAYFDVKSKEIEDIQRLR